MIQLAYFFTNAPFEGLLAEAVSKPEHSPHWF
jgi:hypothetical protein